MKTNLFSSKFAREKKKEKIFLLQHTTASTAAAQLSIFQPYIYIYIMPLTLLPDCVRIFPAHGSWELGILNVLAIRRPMGIGAEAGWIVEKTHWHMAFASWKFNSTYLPWSILIVHFIKFRLIYCHVLC